MLFQILIAAACIHLHPHSSVRAISDENIIKNVNSDKSFLNAIKLLQNKAEWEIHSSTNYFEPTATEENDLINHDKQDYLPPRSASPLLNLDNAASFYAPVARPHQDLKAGYLKNNRLSLCPINGRQSQATLPATEKEPKSLDVNELAAITKLVHMFIMRGGDAKSRMKAAYCQISLDMRKLISKSATNLRLADYQWKMYGHRNRVIVLLGLLGSNEEAAKVPIPERWKSFKGADAYFLDVCRLQSRMKRTIATEPAESEDWNRALSVKQKIDRIDEYFVKSPQFLPKNPVIHEKEVAQHTQNKPSGFPTLPLVNEERRVHHISPSTYEMLKTPYVQRIEGDKSSDEHTLVDEKSNWYHRMHKSIRRGIGSIRRKKSSMNGQ